MSSGSAGFGLVIDLEVNVFKDALDRRRLAFLGKLRSRISFGLYVASIASYCSSVITFSAISRFLKI